MGGTLLPEEGFLGRREPLAEMLQECAHVPRLLEDNPRDEYPFLVEPLGCLALHCDLLLFECKAAGVTKADMDLYKSEALDDAAKSDILKRYYGIEEKGQAMGKQSTTFTMVGALAYIFTHPEAKEAQLYHREHMGLGKCSKCEGGSCELPEKPEVVYDDAVRSLS